MDQQALYGVGRQGGQPAPNTQEKAVTVERDIFLALGLMQLDTDSLTPADYRRWMREHDAVKAAMTYKILACVSRGWEITPASDDPQHVRQAEFVKAQLANIRGGGNRFLRRALMALPLGWSIHEIVLEPIVSGQWAGLYGLKALKEKKPETFRLVAGQYGDIEKLEQQTGKYSLNYADLSRFLDYFVIFMPDHDGDWKPHSDLEAAHRWVVAKELVSKFWNIFLEQFASPTPVGTAPAGTTQEEMKKLGEFLAKLNIHKSVVLKEGWKVDLLEAARRGGDEYHKAMDYFDRMIRLSILVPSLTMEEGQRGAYSLGSQHAENFVMVLESIGEDLADVINDQLIRRLVDWNFATDEYPKFKWKPFKSDRFHEMAKSMALLVEKGVVSPDDPFVRDRLGLPADTHSPGAGGPPAPGTPARHASFGAPAGLSSLRHADKANFAEYEKRLDRLEEEAVQIMVGVTATWLQQIKKWIRAKQLVERRAVNDLDQLQLKGVGEFRDALVRLLGHSVQWGFSDARDEVNRGLKAVGRDPLPDLGDTAKVNLKAEERSALAEVIEFWDGKAPIQRDLLLFYRRRSFTIAGVHRDRILREAQDLIGRGIMRGASYREIEQELADMFNPYLSTPGAVDPGLADPYRIQTIVRTNASEAYNTGRMNLFRHPEVQGFIKAFEYSAVMDDRTTEFCASWHGAVIKESDPAHGRVNPPNHYRCRSVLIPIIEGEKFDLTKPLPAEEPATGFRM